MARTRDPLVEKRNQKLVTDFTEGRFQSYATLGRTHGMSEQMVYRVLSEANLVDRSRRTPRIKVGDQEPISNLHVFLGAEIEAHYREITLDKRAEGKMGQLALALGMSPQRISAVIKGVEDVTFSELRKVSEWIKISLSELMTRCAIREQACRLPPRLGNTGS